MKSQSAMEYLMTYGWAILIIAVVLGAIYSLGLFNAVSLAPKAAPGSCQVFRPNGPFSTVYISLQGICNTEPPQYVAQFNGAPSFFSTGTAGLPLGSAARSVSAWAYFIGGTAGTIYMYGDSTMVYHQSNIQVNNGAAYFSGQGDDYATTLAIKPNTWYFVGYTYAAGATTVTIYVNSQSQVSTALTPLSTTLSATNPPSVIGSQPGLSSEYYKGLISDVQVYNTSLDANSMLALYQEGVGGAPINLQSLVAWWPLDGNGNDYSGNINNGVPTNVIFISQWQNGYTPP